MLIANFSEGSKLSFVTIVLQKPEFHTISFGLFVKSVFFLVYCRCVSVASVCRIAAYFYLTTSRQLRWMSALTVGYSLVLLNQGAQCCCDFMYKKFSSSLNVLFNIKFLALICRRFLG